MGRAVSEDCQAASATLLHPVNPLTFITRSARLNKQRSGDLSLPPPRISEIPRFCQRRKSLHLLSKFSSQYIAIPSVIPYIYTYKSEPINVKHLPNIITALRIVGSIGLLFCNVAGWQFWTLYVFCGISDMIDGWLARRLHVESKTGSVLDSIADLSFMACCAIQLLPILSIPSWLWMWAGIIVIIKIVNQIIALIYIKRFCFPHTIANKLTGFLLFIAVPTIGWHIIPIVIVAITATFAAIQEGHSIIHWRATSIER